MPPCGLFEMIAKSRLRNASELLELLEREVIGMLPEHLFDELLLLFVDSLLMQGARPRLSGSPAGCSSLA